MTIKARLETGRLVLEPFEERHIGERYLGWLRDPRVLRWSENRFREHTIESCHAYLRSFDGTPNLFYAIVAKDPALGHVGNLNVYVQPRHGIADIGILVGEPAVWGTGIGGEAWTVMLQHLLRSGIRKVTGGCVADNTAMVRIMERAGMEEDGRRRQQYVYDGRAVDIVYFASFGSEGSE